MKKWLISVRMMWVFIVCMGIALPVSADISVSLDKEQIGVGETVRLTISVDNPAMINQLDLAVLDQNFEVVGRSIKSLISMANGDVRKETHLELTLRPRSVGALTIPSITVGQTKTDPLVLNVLEASTQSPQQAVGVLPVLIEAEWENTAKPYVQSQLNLVIRIYHSGSLPGAALDEPRPKDALVKRLGEDVHSVKTKNGTEYQTLERHYAVFPQKSGEFILPAIPMQMRAPVPKDQARRLFGFDVFNRRMITLRTEPLKLNILPRPAEDSARHWLPAEQIKLERTGMPTDAVSVGEAINMVLEVNAIGLNAEQLPELSLSVNDSQFSVYPDEPTFENASDGRVLAGSRKQTFVLIPTQAGETSLPEIELAWWDKTLDKQMRAVLPPVDLNIIAVPGSETEALAVQAASQTASQVSPNSLDALEADANHKNVNAEQSDVRFWKGVAGVLFAAWLLMLGYFLLNRHLNARKSNQACDESPDAASAYTQIRQALKTQKWDELWAALNEYGRVRWPESPPISPRNWAEKLEDTRVEAILSSLEAQLFDGHGTEGWQGSAFKDDVIPLLRHYSRRENRLWTKSESAQSLPALYPNG